MQFLVKKYNLDFIKQTKRVYICSTISRAALNVRIWCSDDSTALSSSIAVEHAFFLQSVINVEFTFRLQVTFLVATCNRLSHIYISIKSVVFNCNYTIPFNSLLLKSKMDNNYALLIYRQSSVKKTARKYSK